MEEDKYIGQVKHFPEIFRTFTLYARAATIVSAVFCEVAVSWEQYQVSPWYHRAFKSHMMRSCANEAKLMRSLFRSYNLSSCWIARKAVASVTCCNLVLLVLLLSRVQDSSRSHLGCGTQTFWPGREQYMSLINTGHSFTLWSAISLDVHAFPFILHSYLFSVSSYLWPQSMGTEMTWQQQTLMHFYHAQMLLYLLFRFLHGTHCIHRCWRPYVYCPGRILWSCDGHL